MSAATLVQAPTQKSVHWGMDYTHCQAPGCGKPLSTDGYSNRRYCDRTCNNRAYKAGRRAGVSTARPLPVVNSMSDYDLGWLVGIIEGEGTISQHRSRYGEREYRYPILAVGMTDEDVVRRCHTIAGVGKVYGPLTPPSRGDHKPHWAWRAQGQSAGVILPLLIPLLGERRRARAEEVLAEWEQK